jgi:hypothetical protein
MKQESCSNGTKVLDEKVLIAKRGLWRSVGVKPVRRSG